FTTAMVVGDKVVVRYRNNVASSGVFELGPRMVFFQIWPGDPLNTDVNQSFIRVDDANVLAVNTTDAHIYDGKATSGMVYTGGSGSGGSGSGSENGGGGGIFRPSQNGHAWVRF